MQYTKPFKGQNALINVFSANLQRISIMSHDFKMACEKELQCHVHDKEFIPLNCRDCDSMVCLDCLVTTHVGHKMCKISDGIEEKVVQLKDAIQKKESACFNLNSIQMNLQQRRHDIRKQKDQIKQRVTDRENEISRQMKHICNQTIERISNLTSEIESPIMEDEKSLELLRNCDFDMDTDQDCIKSFYFYRRFQLLDSRYKRQTQGDLPFTFVIPEVPLEKLTEIFGSVTADEMLSSDETTDLQTDNNGTNFTAEAVHHHKVYFSPKDHITTKLKTMLTRCWKKLNILHMYQNWRK